MLAAEGETPDPMCSLPGGQYGNAKFLLCPKPESFGSHHLVHTQFLLPPSSFSLAVGNLCQQNDVTSVTKVVRGFVLSYKRRE